MFKKYFFSLVFFVIFCQPVYAAERTHLVLDAATLEKGYTVISPDNKLRLGIPAQELSGSAEVSLEQKNRDQQPLPSKYRQVSKSYYYALDNQNNPAALLNLSLNYNVNNIQLGHKRWLFYWDSSLGKWKKLASTVDYAQNLVKLSWSQPAAQIIVLEKKTRKLKAASENRLGLYAPSAIALDVNSNQVLYSEMSDAPRSLASLTKIMTALIFMESGTSLDKAITFSAEDETYGATIDLEVGDVVETRDLLYGTLVASANSAARALMRSTGMSEAEFVAAMNAKAQALGLTQTVFVEPTGLDAGNISTAYEYSQIVKAALAYQDIKDISLTEYYTFYTQAGKFVSALSTNRLIKDHTALPLILQKTGYIGEAGHCLTLVTEKNEEQLIIVVMGETDPTTRFQEGEYLTNWIWDYSY